MYDKESQIYHNTQDALYKESAIRLNRHTCQDGTSSMFAQGSCYKDNDVFVTIEKAK